MQFNAKTIFALIAAVSTASAAVIDTRASTTTVEVFTKQNCEGDAATFTIASNNCHKTGGFQSFKITSPGPSGQTIISYSNNNCDSTGMGSDNAMEYLTASYTSACTNSHNSNGGSNAVGSYNSS